MTTELHSDLLFHYQVNDFKKCVCVIAVRVQLKEASFWAHLDQRGFLHDIQSMYDLYTAVA